MTMIERVAEALKNTPRRKGGFVDYETLARSAIAGMLEPTEAMIEASNREWDGRMSYRSSGAWQAMINKALEGE